MEFGSQVAERYSQGNLVPSSQSLYQYAQFYLQQNNYQLAIACFQQACMAEPRNATYWLGYAECLKSFGLLEKSLVAYQTAAKFENSCILQLTIGLVHESLGQNELALLCFNNALTLDCTNFLAYNYKGNLLRKQKLHQEAIKTFLTGIGLAGSNEHLYNNLGNCYLDLHKVKEAQECYLRAIEINPAMTAAHCNISSILKMQGNISQALLHCHQAVMIDPSCSEAYTCMALILKDSQSLSQCLTYYQYSLQLNPSSSLTLNNLANVMKDMGDVPNAILCYKKALEITPFFPEAFCNMVYAKTFICDWENRDKDFEELVKFLKHQVDTGVVPSVQPFHAMVYPLAPEDKLVISQKYAEHTKTLVANYPCFQTYKYTPKNKIRIGYVSSDFGDHPTAHLMQSVFGMHDKSRFVVYCFSLSPNDCSSYRLKIQNECDYFYDLSGESDSYRAASLIHSCAIDILVNLNGYTKGSRNEIFALRPAKVQVSLCGFPNTMGADYIDYLVTDKTASPPEYKKYYSEKLLYMPNSYFVNDHAQSTLGLLKQRPTREEIGLPRDKFVFANFNQLYKIDPDTFKIWMRILKRVPNSVLWLLRFPASGEANILKHAASCGIDSSRIVFTEVAPKTFHINRCYLADLCLDTPLCNGHTTGCDLLWSGLPMVTYPLKSLASRVGASLCKALRCEEMIAISHTDYEEKAVRLATGPVHPQQEAHLPLHIKHRGGSTELKLLRLKVEHNRFTTPLFDTKRWVRDYESILKSII